MPARQSSLQVRHTARSEELDALCRSHRDRGFEVPGFPTNELGAQQPGTEEEIAAFCSTSYGVSFPTRSMIVIRGTCQYPLHETLIRE